MYEKTLITHPPYNLKRIWRKVCMVISRQSLLLPSFRCKILQLGGVKIDGKSFIGSNVSFDGIYPNLIEIGEGCVITEGVHILSHFLNTKDHMFYAGKVVIGKKVFIGMNTLIVNAVNIGDGAIIGAGSIVNCDIPSKELWGGNPAKFIKKLN